ncbi:MAG: ATP-binding protein, partial [bacterium]|nr:ATP-binding protein [bacterium]
MSGILPISVRDLLRRVEAPRVEFKKDWNLGPTARQVLKTICAFANDYQNVNGGYVVLGVEAAEGVASLPPPGLDPKRLETVQRQILDQCQTITPAYQPTLSPEIVDGRHVLVIWVRPSPNRPHSIPASKDGRHRYFVRLGAQTRIAKGQVLQQLLQSTAAVPFDDDKAVGFTVEDLNATLLREFLRETGREDLLAEPDQLEIYRALGLVSKLNGREVPRNVALLF